jgi:UDP-2,3-diacylglucosamine hydrolase
MSAPERPDPSPAFSGRTEGNLVAIADSHMVRHDEELGRFVACLDSLARDTAKLYLLGDIFNIWLGSKRFEMEHMGPVLDALRRLARAGVEVRLVEGNRDFHVADGYLGDPFAAVVPDGEETFFAGRRFWLTHGDLVNEADRQYRMWRRFSKSRALWTAFRALPSGIGTSAGNALEARLRGTNVRHKAYFPQEACERYGRRLIALGYDRILMGHVHLERVLDLESEGRAGKLIVLPDWRSSHRYLRFGADGSERFVDVPG